ncbi:hypothetical protein [Streptococcus thoraltensis]|uniref:hypothetical protein n=1 Tax=Streptococcus thoraltensis TaxID=55085 RepID=UPI000366C9EB|nr:hypothetical protein [Streptococcus thoraltensis]MDY4760674.1 hypothetical protein [Streptococcus thoraltensis]
MMPKIFLKKYQLYAIAIGLSLLAIAAVLYSFGIFVSSVSLENYFSNWSFFSGLLGSLVIFGVSFLRPVALWNTVSQYAGKYLLMLNPVLMILGTSLYLISIALGGLSSFWGIGLILLGAGKTVLDVFRTP